MRGHREQSGPATQHRVVSSKEPTTHRRAAWILGVVLVTAAFSGYFTGLRQTGSQLNRTKTMSLVVPAAHALTETQTTLAAPASTYANQNRKVDGPNAGWTNHLVKIVQPVVDYSTLTNVTESERALALQERAGRRAYDGAPPVVPHPVAQDSAASCLACHESGMVVKDKVASKISHPPYTSCTQCHVPAVGTRIPLTEVALLDPIAENSFVGIEAPLKGSRAWPLAPPTVPHSTLMRSDCLSCHGPQGLFGLRTPHPDRRSCTQCHVPGAEMDQRLFIPSSPGESPLLIHPSIALQ